MKNKSWVPIGAAILSMIFWSFSFVWIKIVYEAYGPLTTVLFRLLISSGLMLAFTILSGKLQKIKSGDLKMFVLLAFFEPFLYFMGESYGLKYVSSTVASVIVATIPLFSPIAAWYFYKEKLSRTNLFGLVITFFGVSLVVLDTSFNFTASPLGVALEFFAVFGAIGYASVLKGISHRYNTFTIITYQNLIGATFFLPFWLIFEMNDFTQVTFNAKAFWAIIKLAIFASTFAFILFTYSVRNMGINKSNTFINVIPICVAIFAYIILGDQLNFHQMIGIAVVISGLFLAQINWKRFKKGTPPIYQA
ncbi:permease of the drug/metabolite transporter superfamily [Aquipluma nitroreducens]|uniref:Permease of the drug/metabolite transporter superfamily n=1 Tax=Aquipluma nitroreducens TaxID=2010828 RepID=A0A5K7SG57_9BACT|nr:DMT family transporter [Aquipluma nitroreducens]BBE20612.1 permease of the drug/metabolite transporter superfamily [Aquipluma nitroreducens]